MIRVKKNPGILRKNNSSHEFHKYEDYVEEILLKETVNINNISQSVFHQLITNLDLAKIIIEKTKTEPHSYTVYLLLDFPDGRFDKFKNYSIPFLIFDSLDYFNMQYIYLPTYKSKIKTVYNGKTIYEIISAIKSDFIKEFIKLCKSYRIKSNKELSEIDDTLNLLFKKVLKK